MIRLSAGSHGKRRARNETDFRPGRASAEAGEKGGELMAVHVEIEEIANGFTVKLFDSEGPEELDKTIFAESFKEAIDKILEWYKEENSQKKE